MKKTLEKKIQTREACIAVLGLGYVGLPLAVNFAKQGFSVLGLDLDCDRVNRLNAKESYTEDVPTKVLAAVVSQGKLSASTDLSLTAKADILIICVPTPLKRKYTPDVSFIVSAVRTVRKYLKKDTLVVMESTTYPGTTRELIKPELEKSGMKAGKDFYLAFSPERIDPGNKSYPVTKIPKVVGGLTEECTKLTAMLYTTIIDKIHKVSSPEAAEMTKLLENSFRIINIGWINEVAMMADKMGIDIWEVIEAAKTKPFGFMPFYPGLGVGGHCIPDDPLYLYWKAKRYGFNSKYIKLSADTNAHMPAYAIGRISGVLEAKGKSLENAKVLVIGVTYKKDVKDLRKSPALKMIGLLQNRVSCVDYHDPLIPYLEIFNIHKKISVDLKSTAIKKYDCVIIATDHSALDYEMILNNARMVFDTRNVFSGRKQEKIFRL